MLRIRSATVEDENVYRRHWEDKEFNYQWLWYSANVRNHEEVREDKEFIETIEEMIERERKITFSDFEGTLKKNRIFIIELDGKIIGSIRFIDYCKGDWRISDWAMELDDDDLKKMVIEKFASLKLPRAKRISICTVHTPAIKFLLDNGFEEEPSYFYYFSLPSKKRDG